MLQST